MKRVAIFPGSFDPFTVGHLNIVERGLHLFDYIIIALGENSQKKYMFTLEQRKALINQVFTGEDRVEVDSYSGLTVNFCNAKSANFILRGIRNGRDLDFEQSIAQMNKELNPDVETVFLVNKPEYSAINSSIVRDIYVNGGDVSSFIPKGIDIGGL